LATEYIEIHRDRIIFHRGMPT